MRSRNKTKPHQKTRVRVFFVWFRGSLIDSTSATQRRGEHLSLWLGHADARQVSDLNLANPSLWLGHADARQVSDLNLANPSLWLGHADARQVYDLPRAIPFEIRSMTAVGDRQNKRPVTASHRLAAHRHGRAISRGVRSTYGCFRVVRELSPVSMAEPFGVRRESPDLSGRRRRFGFYSHPFAPRLYHSSPYSLIITAPFHSNSRRSNGCAGHRVHPHLLSRRLYQFTSGALHTPGRSKV